jgi:hypothetical protein
VPLITEPPDSSPVFDHSGISINPNLDAYHQPDTSCRTSRCFSITPTPSKDEGTHREALDRPRVKIFYPVQMSRSSLPEVPLIVCSLHRVFPLSCCSCSLHLLHHHASNHLQAHSCLYSLSVLCYSFWPAMERGNPDRGTYPADKCSWLEAKAQGSPSMARAAKTTRTRRIPFAATLMQMHVSYLLVTSVSGLHT